MRVVMVEVTDVPPPGMLNLYYSPPSGGRSQVGHDVVEGDTVEIIASELARRVVNDRQWCTGSFEATTSGNKIMIICRDEVANVRVYTDPGVEVLKISDWGK